MDMNIRTTTAIIKPKQPSTFRITKYIASKIHTNILEAPGNIAPMTINPSIKTIIDMPISSIK